MWNSTRTLWVRKGPGEGEVGLMECDRASKIKVRHVHTWECHSEAWTWYNSHFKSTGGDGSEIPPHRIGEVSTHKQPSTETPSRPASRDSEAVRPSAQQEDTRTSFKLPTLPAQRDSRNWRERQEALGNCSLRSGNLPQKPALSNKILGG